MPAKVSKDDCVGCGNCVDACPVDAITLNDVAEVDEGECIECGSCVSACPADAITMN